MFLAPDDPPGVAYEFYSPFAHVEGRFEWCRVRSASHGIFDLFIVLGPTVEDPAAVYVNSALGADFMAKRFPECWTIRVAPGGLIIEESADGCTVTGTLKAEEGPVLEAEMQLSASPQQLPEQVAYGGQGAPVWGGKLTCWGVDLVLRGKVTGHLSGPEMEERFAGEPCVVTVGSFGRLAPR